MTSQPITSYPLGTNTAEYERLKFQHEVWGDVTRACFDRIGVAPGWRCLDLGCGPGFATFDLCQRVERSGEVIALDESALWVEYLQHEQRERALANLRIVRARIQEAELEPESLDLIFARWVLSFVPEPAAIIRRLSRALKPGGLFVIEDYNHEGISVFPESEGMRAVVRATRALYAQAGGDAWIAGRATRIFHEAGLSEPVLVPNVKCGGPQSGVFQWAGRFFPPFSAVMEQKGLMTSAERTRFLAEWAERERDPDALFFSPYVVDAVARKQ